MRGLLALVVLVTVVACDEQKIECRDGQDCLDGYRCDDGWCVHETEKGDTGSSSGPGGSSTSGIGGSTSGSGSGGTSSSTTASGSSGEACNPSVTGGSKEDLYVEFQRALCVYEQRCAETRGKRFSSVDACTDHHALERASAQSTFGSDFGSLIDPAVRTPDQEAYARCISDLLCNASCDLSNPQLLTWCGAALSWTNGRSVGESCAWGWAIQPLDWQSVMYMGSNSFCNNGLYCDETQKHCLSLKRDGEPCDERDRQDWTCASNYCTPSYQCGKIAKGEHCPRVGDGLVCLAELHCGDCPTDYRTCTCQPIRGSGSCQVDGHCYQDFHCAPVAGGDGGTCAPD